jgi:hypothetical protein
MEDSVTFVKDVLQKEQNGISIISNASMNPFLHVMIAWILSRMKSTSSNSILTKRNGSRPDAVILIGSEVASRKPLNLIATKTGKPS